MTSDAKPFLQGAKFAYMIAIPDWHPTPVNKLLKHWAIAAKLKKSDRQMIWAYSTGIPKAIGKRSLEVEIILGKGQRACDPDAYFKSLNDALVHAGMLVDDNRQNVDLKPVIFTRSTRKSTIITLRDM